MSKGNTFENDVLKLIFYGTAIDGLAENDSSSPLTSLYVALHSADPGEAGTPETNEVAYTGYARVAVARSALGWTVTDNVVVPLNNIDFPECSAGSDTATHVSIGTTASGAGKILYYGALDASIAISAGVTPRVKSNSTITED